MCDTEKDTEESFELIARQAILSRHDSVLGYELFARDEVSGPMEDPFLCSARVLIKTFSTYSVEDLLCGKPAFINFTNNYFDEKSLALFPTKYVIPEFTFTEKPSREFIDTLIHLKNQGFRLSLDRFTALPWQTALMRLFDYVKIDCLANTPEKWDIWTTQIRKMDTKHQPFIIGTRVETNLIAQKCFESGIDYTQGFYYMKPEIIKGKSLTTNQYNIFKIINMLIDDSPVSLIDEEFRRDPNLSYYLLKYLNSAGMTRGQTIESIHQAIVLIGRNPLQSWLTMLLFAGKSHEISNVMNIAITRAKFAELIRHKTPHMDSHPNSLHRSFFCGVLSMLDVYLRIPIVSLLSELNISEDMRNSILYNTGEDGLILSLIKAIETADMGRVAELSKHMTVSPEDINATYMESITWANGITLH